MAAGVSPAALEQLLGSQKTYGDFIQEAPAVHPGADRIQGTVCGVRLGDITDPVMLQVRRLDKLVDELAKGKPLEKIMER